MLHSYNEPPLKLRAERDYRIGTQAAFMILFASFSGDMLKSIFVFGFGLLLPILGAFIIPFLFTPLFFVFFYPWFKSLNVGLFDKWPKIVCWFFAFTPTPMAQLVGNFITILMSRRHDRAAHKKAKAEYEKTGEYNPRKFL